MLNNRYILDKKIGSGSFGVIYKAFDNINQKEVAIKMEAVTSNSPQLHWEYRMYKHLKHLETIPKIYEFFTDSYKDVPRSCMVMDLFKASLEDKIEEYYSFCLKTVLQLAVQMIKIIKEVHSNSIIHRDLKPDNFMLDDENNLFLIDFGMAKYYCDPITKTHIKYRDNKSLSGTPRYASINNHLGIEQSRRDDLETIMHILVYFFEGKLPWQGIKEKSKKRKMRKILEKKFSTPIDVLLKNLPDEFTEYFKIIRFMSFDEKPNYDYLIKLFEDCATRKNIILDYKYEWSDLSSEPESSENKENTDNNINSEISKTSETF